MEIHFVSMNQEWTSEIKKLFPEQNIKVTCGDVQTIPTGSAAFVSPANCLGFMDGGIDYVYIRKMFPGCEKKVKETIREIGCKTSLGRPYLPIGSAFAVPLGDSTALICAPTMFLPHDVSKTRNAYLSFLAALLVFKKVNKYKTLVVTSHCCGYGKMSAETSAEQMRQAYDDFLSGNYPAAISLSENIILMPNYDTEQPDNYDNREIKDIPIQNLFKR